MITPFTRINKNNYDFIILHFYSGSENKRKLNS